MLGFLDFGELGRLSDLCFFSLPLRVSVLEALLFFLSFRFDAPLFWPPSSFEVSFLEGDAPLEVSRLTFGDFFREISSYLDMSSFSDAFWFFYLIEACLLGFGDDIVKWILNFNFYMSSVKKIDDDLKNLNSFLAQRKLSFLIF